MPCLPACCLVRGQREVRGPQWDQNTLCAAQRAPARCGVRFALKIAPNTALGPRTKPQYHLARCYRRLGSIVDADTRRGASKNDNESNGRERGRSCRPRLRSTAGARGRIVGLGADHSPIFERCPPYIYPKATARGVRVRRTWVCAGCAARSHDGRRPPQHRHIPCA